MEVVPTIVASSPIARCRKPPAFACWYWRPASSSKRRISAIVSSNSRQMAWSGSAMRRRPLAIAGYVGLGCLRALLRHRRSR